MLTPGEVTGVILVGGKSSRMGRDKAFLPLESFPFIEKVLSTLRTSLRSIVLIGDRPERFENYGLAVYPDIFPGSALGGLYTGLLLSETPYIFACACDLPFANPFVLRRMLAGGVGFDAVVPLRERHPEPLFALYHKNCLDPMKKLLEAGNYRIRDLYPEIRVRFVPPEEFADIDDNEMAFLNVNTIEEYEAILRKGRT